MYVDVFALPLDPDGNLFTAPQCDSRNQVVTIHCILMGIPEQIIETIQQLQHTVSYFLDVQRHVTMEQECNQRAGVAPSIVKQPH